MSAEENGGATARPPVPVTHWNTLGRAIRDVRVAQGLTQYQLAEHAGVSRSWLARVETGHRKAEIEFVLRLVHALGLQLTVAPVASDLARDDPDLQRALREAGLS